MPYNLKRISKYSAYFLAASTSVLAGTAWAQTTQSAADTSLQEIVVTSTRQSEQISKVPLSISAYSQKELDNQGVRSFQDIVSLTPGLNYTPLAAFQAQSITIRGIESSVGAQTTGIYIDDVPIQDRSANLDPGSALPKVFDLDRVEVLRGPQGTLFGAGSEGGAVRFITPQPSLTSMSTYARGELSGTEHGGTNYEAGVAVGGPIVNDKVGFRVSAWDRHDSGWINRIDPNTNALLKKDANSQDSNAFKAALLFAPADNIKITPSLYYQETLNRDSGRYFVAYSNPDAGIFNNGHQIAEPDKNRFYLPSLTIVANGGGLTFTSVSAYYNRTQSGVYDFSDLDYDLSFAFTGRFPLPLIAPDSYAGSPIFTGADQNNLSQEFRIQPENQNGRLNWLAGVFLSRNRETTTGIEPDPSLASFFAGFSGVPNVDFSGRPGGDVVFYERESSIDKQAAAFANVDFSVTPTLKLTAGARIAKTTFSFKDTIAGSVGNAPNASGSQSQTPVTPKVSLSWQKDSDNLFYVTYAQGYREGGANTPVPTTPPCTANLQTIGLTSAPNSYNSDTTDSYEIGAKNRLFDGALQIASSAYHITWKNIQESVTLPDCSGSFITNLGNASSNGFDIALTARPTRDLTLSGSVGYTKITYSDTISEGTEHLVDKGSVVDQNQPPWQFSITGQYDFALMAQKAYVRVTDQYSSQNNGSFTTRDDPNAAGSDPTLLPNPAYNRLNLRIGTNWNGADISLFADNLLDAHPQLFYSELFSNRLYFASTLTPRVAGVQVSFRY